MARVLKKGLFRRGKKLAKKGKHMMVASMSDSKRRKKFLHKQIKRSKRT